MDLFHSKNAYGQNMEGVVLIADLVQQSRRTSCAVFLNASTRKVTSSGFLKSFLHDHSDNI
jgi:hypothetical protein